MILMIQLIYKSINQGEYNMRCDKTGLSEEDWMTIFDIINVYDPGDIAHVYPNMATPEFLQNVNRVFHTVQKHIERIKGPGMPAGGFPSNNPQDQQWLHDS